MTLDSDITKEDLERWANDPGVNAPGLAAYALTILAERDALRTRITEIADDRLGLQVPGTPVSDMLDALDKAHSEWRLRALNLKAAAARLCRELDIELRGRHVGGACVLAWQTLSALVSDASAVDDSSLRKRILGFRALPANWDSYGAPPPSEKAIEVSLALTGSMRVAPLADGGIGIDLGPDTVEGPWVSVDVAQDGSMEMEASVAKPPSPPAPWPASLLDPNVTPEQIEAAMGKRTGIMVGGLLGDKPWEERGSHELVEEAALSPARRRHSDTQDPNKCGRCRGIREGRIVGTCSTHQNRDGTSIEPAPKPEAPEPPREHELKTWPAYYDAVARGDKPFEIRRDDRMYCVGDTLHLRRWTPADGYSGESIRVRVTYVTDGGQLGCLTPGHVALGIRVLATADATDEERARAWSDGTKVAALESANAKLRAALESLIEAIYSGAPLTWASAECIVSASSYEKVLVAACVDARKAMKETT